MRYHDLNFSWQTSEEMAEAFSGELWSRKLEAQSVKVLIVGVTGFGDVCNVRGEKEHVLRSRLKGKGHLQPFLPAPMRNIDPYH